MRKSSAPSLKTLSSVAKKRKFSTPFSNTLLTADQDARTSTDQDVSTISSVETVVKTVDYPNKDKQFPEFSSRPLKNNKFGAVYNANSKKNISGKKSSNPSKTLPLLTSNSNISSKSASDDVSNDVMEKYFEVVW